jgi:hypothetical protein
VAPVARGWYVNRPIDRLLERVGLGLVELEPDI